jgi:hypothetical protein
MTEATHMTRISILILVVLTACSEPAPSAAISQEANPPSEWSVAHALATGPRCGIDEIVHRVEGQPRRPSDSSEVSCPESPALLDPEYGVAPSAVFYFDLSMEHDAEAARRGYPGFVFEGSMADVGPLGSPGLQCIYVGCTKLQVAWEGVPTEGLESCLGPLTGGTSRPAAKAPDCPAAVKIAGAYRPFTRKRLQGAYANGGPAACCYAIPKPVPPSALPTAPSP